MRLDRYAGKAAKYAVMKRQPDGTFSHVEELDCFVIKRQDINSDSALAGYAHSARTTDSELYEDVERLRREWREKSATQGDMKKPD